MKAQFGEVKKLKQCYGTPEPGKYALESEPPKAVHWDHCREQFASKFSEITPGFYFSHPPGKSLDIGEFMARFESIVGLKLPSTFSETNRDTILWTEPSQFWLDCQMKRSLLTIVLRCGVNYLADKDNFDDALFGEYKESIYVKETKSATLRFMFGFTKFTGNITSITSTSSVIKHGWREEFKPLDDSTIRRRLVLPEGKAKESSIIGLESLWT